MMKFQVKTIAVALATASLAFGASAASIDFHGYGRSGVGSATKGGSLVCYRLGNMGFFRLGNECDTYLELGFDANLAEKKGTEFKLHTMVVGGTQQLNDWEQASPSWRQAWTEATNIGSGPLANSSLWAGKRYYKRQDIHMLDYFTNAVTGPGAGLESVDMNFAKFSYAYMRQGGDLNWDGNTYTDSNGDTVKIVPGNGFAPNYASGGDKTSTNHDFRFEGIQIAGGNGGSVDVMTNIVRRNTRNGAAGLNGWALTAQHSIGVLGGFNKVILTKATNGANMDHSARWWADNNYRFSGLRLMDQMVFKAGPVNGEATIGLLREEQNGGKADKTFIVGSRMWYHFNDLYSVGGEAGHVQVKPGNGGEKRSLNKLTLSAQISAGADYWARPSIRVYYTQAKWNDAARGSVACTGRDCGVTAAGYPTETSGGTYGIQWDAWW